VETLPVYRERCEECKSDNTRSYAKYGTDIVIIVCKSCGYRKEKNNHRITRIKEGEK